MNAEAHKLSRKCGIMKHAGVIERLIHCPPESQFTGINTERMPSLLGGKGAVGGGGLRYYDRKKKRLCVFDA